MEFTTVYFKKNDNSTGNVLIRDDKVTKTLKELNKKTRAWIN